MVADRDEGSQNQMEIGDAGDVIAARRRAGARERLPAAPRPAGSVASRSASHRDADK